MTLSTDMNNVSSGESDKKTMWSPDTILQVNTNALQQYTEIMQMFYAENIGWFQALCESYYQVYFNPKKELEKQWSEKVSLEDIRKSYLKAIYNHIWQKFASQADTTDLYMLKSFSYKLSLTLSILNQILEDNPNISKDDCIVLCEIELTKRHFNPKEIIIAKEIISNVLKYFPN